MFPCKVLVIDDDKEDFEILSEAFDECGIIGLHNVSSATKAFLYLQEIEHDCLPRLIVAEAFLLGISTKKFLKDIKAMDKYKHIHVIVLSTGAPDNEIRLCKELGALDYVNKPSSYKEYVRVASEMKSKVGLL